MPLYLLFILAGIKCAKCIVGAGKHVVLLGGAGSPDFVPNEVCTLNLDTMEWSRPSTARTAYSITGHASTVLNRTKILVCGGARNGTTTFDLSLLNTDTMKWQVVYD